MKKIQYTPQHALQGGRARKGSLMRWFAGIVGLILSIVMSTQAHVETKEKISIGIEGAYKPWGFITAGGKLNGMEIDLFYDLCERMKVECSISSQNWNGLIPSLMSGKFDIILGLSINEDRKRVIDFSKPYATDPSSFLVQNSSPIRELTENLGSACLNLNNDYEAAIAVIEKIRHALKGRVIGAQTGTVNVAFLKQYFQDAVEIREYDSIEQHNLDLISGRVDAIFAHLQTIQSLNRYNGRGKRLVSAGPAFIGGVLGPGIGAGIRKNNTRLADLLNQAISSAIADGEVKKISVKWFGVDLSPISTNCSR